MFFNELDIKTAEPEISYITINNKQVAIYDMIPAQEQFDLIMATVDKAEKFGIYNPYLIELFLTLHLIAMHTDITFEEDDWAKPMELYDKVKTSGLFDAVVTKIPKETIENYMNFIDRTIEAREKSDLSIATTLNNYLDEFPKLMEQAAKTVQEFDPQKFQEVVKFAEAANGNRPIPLGKK